MLEEPGIKLLIHKENFSFFTGKKICRHIVKLKSLACIFSVEYLRGNMITDNHIKPANENPFYFRTSLQTPSVKNGRSIFCYEYSCIK